MQSNLRNIFAPTLAFLLLLISPVVAESGQILHSFSGTDGSHPFGLTSDAEGNFYGVANAGGGAQNCCGTVFELSPEGIEWKATVLHRFEGGQDGSGPIGTLAFDANGDLFGVTESGGAPGKPCKSTCGTIFELTPKSGGGWTYSQIYRFLGNTAGDGSGPDAGVIVDAGGNLYGTTEFGGLVTSAEQCLEAAGCGTVFELSPGAGGWTETVLYKFAGNPDGAFPRSPVLFDANGDLDGATSRGGGGDCTLDTGCGSIFQLVRSGSTWTEHLLHGFQSAEGLIPYQGLLLDGVGNLYGVANIGGPSGVGSVFELSPGPGGSWTESTLFGFPQNSDGYWPAGGLTADASGNLYGSGSGGGAGDAGTIFKLTPASGGAFTFSLVAGFEGAEGPSMPNGNLVLDSAGNLYGSAAYGGAKGDGVVFKITP